MSNGNTNVELNKRLKVSELKYLLSFFSRNLDQPKMQ